MRAREILKLLQISSTTLYKYVKKGLITVDSEINGQYLYNKESVYRLLTGKHKYNN